MIKQYETVFIATPVLSEAQMKETVKKYIDYIVAKGGEIVYEEDWGLKQLAYPIQKKTTGFYYLIEFKADTQVVAKLDEIIESCSLLLDRVSELLETPVLFVHDLATLGNDVVSVLLYRFLHLSLRQNGSCNENGFVLFDHFVCN